MLFRPKGAERVDLLHRARRIRHRLPEPRLVAALMVKFLLDCFTTLCRNMTLNQLNGKASMLWTIIVILIVLWLLGFIGHFGGSLIHLLLVIAVVILIINLLQGRRGP
jgi:hypothetical protein